jgi:hypothetical protein
MKNQVYQYQSVTSVRICSTFTFIMKQVNTVYETNLYPTNRS